MAAPPCKADRPSKPAAIKSGTFAPNRMVAWVRSKAPATRPPTVIAKSAFLFPNCMIWVVRRRLYISARLTEEAQKLAGLAGEGATGCNRRRRLLESRAGDVP